MLNNTDDTSTEQHPIEERIRSILHERFGISSLYPYQELVIRTILERGGLFGKQRKETAYEHQIVVLPTGSGKSVCFMLPALLLTGITVVVYPLLSLMRDQGRRMEKLGMKALYLQGGQSVAQRNTIWNDLRMGVSRFLITNPETLKNEEILIRLSSFSISLLVIDEVHTVTQWGETFRPSYLMLPNVIERLKPEQITAFTATASPRIIMRITQILFHGNPAHVVKGNPDRPNIFYRALPSLCKIHDLEMLIRYTIARPAVVFCSTRDRCERTAWELTRRFRDHDIRYYHAGLTKEERMATESWFFTSRSAILCATSAYGMGVDKNDIRTVVHLDLCPDVESFLQESGRAGRDGKPASSIVLIGKEERQRTNKELPNSPFCQLLEAFSQTVQCRRSSLLALMGFPNESCSGCDVCAFRTVTVADGKAEILQLLRTPPFRYAKGEAAHVLAATRSLYLCPPSSRSNPSFGLLKLWEPDDIVEAIEELQEQKEVHMVQRGPWKGRLAVRPTHLFLFHGSGTSA